MRLAVFPTTPRSTLGTSLIRMGGGGVGGAVVTSILSMDMLSMAQSTLVPSLMGESALSPCQSAAKTVLQGKRAQHRCRPCMADQAGGILLCA